MHRRDFLQATAAALALELPARGLAAPAETPSPIQPIDPDPATGSSRAVVVAAGQALLHMTAPPPGRSDAPEGLEAQFERCFDALSAESPVEKIIKLNIAVQEEADAVQVRRLLAERYPGGYKPAVSYVVGRLGTAGARLAVDAVAARPAAPTETAVSRRPGAAMLPPGMRVYVSGQAEKADDLRSATRATLQSLRQTLAWLDLDASRVVQARSFLTPMSQVDQVVEEMETFFQGQILPPLSFVEWKSALPIEIELVVGAAGVESGEAAGPVEYLTPPGMTASPVFSRVARITRGRTIYTSGLYGRQAGHNAEEQIRDIFAQLKELLNQAGSDLRHMAKATYFVSTDEASTKLNAIRPEYYDPQRPPAASKAMVAGVGMPDRCVTLDMIAVAGE